MTLTRGKEYGIGRRQGCWRSGPILEIPQYFPAELRGHEVLSERTKRIVVGNLMAGAKFEGTLGAVADTF